MADPDRPRWSYPRCGQRDGRLNYRRARVGRVGGDRRAHSSGRGRRTATVPAASGVAAPRRGFSPVAAVTNVERHISCQTRAVLRRQPRLRRLPDGASPAGRLAGWQDRACATAN
jgi:hypothetical protein